MAGRTNKATRFLGQVEIITGKVGDVGLVLKLPAAQTVDAFQIQNSAGTVIWSIGKTGTEKLVGERTALTAITASGAVAASTPASYVITKAGVAALTLAAPVTGTDDGIIIEITSGTAFAHTLTATGLLNTGSASVDVATFAAFAGASIRLQAYLAKWNVMASTGITFT